jgi:hypothetical protein
MMIWQREGFSLSFAEPDDRWLGKKTISSFLVWPRVKPVSDNETIVLGGTLHGFDVLTIATINRFTFHGQTEYFLSREY